MSSIKYMILICMGIYILGCGSNNTKDTPAETTTRPLHIACVGDSITEGTGLKNPSIESYPAQLATLVAKDIVVKNFGTKGTTALKSADHPYWLSQNYQYSHSYQPDIVIIMLGTNDAKDKNWKNKNAFISDYVALIKSYQKLASNPTIYLCFPPPVYANIAGISDDRIRNDVIPKIKKIATKSNVETIDIYTLLNHKEALFPDKIHPNAKGAKQMAQAIYGVIY